MLNNIKTIVVEYLMYTIITRTNRHVPTTVFSSYFILLARTFDSIYTNWILSIPFSSLYRLLLYFFGFHSKHSIVSLFCHLYCMRKLSFYTHMLPIHLSFHYSTEKASVSPALCFRNLADTKLKIHVLHFRKIIICHSITLCLLHLYPTAYTMCECLIFRFQHLFFVLSTSKRA